MKRSDVLNLFISKLANIRVANGYNTDAGQEVTRITEANPEPEQDSIVLIAGREDFGAVTRAVRNVQRTLQTKISGVFVDAEASIDNVERAEKFVEDLLMFWEKEKNLGLNGLSIRLDAVDVFNDENGRISEVVADFTIIH